MINFLYRVWVDSLAWLDALRGRHEGPYVCMSLLAGTGMVSARLS